MLVSTIAYDALALGSPFRVPVHPRILMVIPGATRFQISLAKTQYDEALRIFQEYTLMQRALIQLIALEA